MNFLNLLQETAEFNHALTDYFQAAGWMRNTVADYLNGKCDREALERVLREYDANESDFERLR